MGLISRVSSRTYRRKKMLRRSALRLSVQHRLVSKYGQSAEYSPNGNWATREEWGGQGNNAPSFYDRRAELNHHFNAGLDSGGDRIHLTVKDFFFNKGHNFFESECFRLMFIFGLFFMYRCYRIDHMASVVRTAPDLKGTNKKTNEEIIVNMSYWQQLGWPTPF